MSEPGAAIARFLDELARDNDIIFDLPAARRALEEHRGAHV